MINLLPPELKEAYLYAHKNVRLVRWVVASALSLAGLAALSTAGLIYVHQASAVYASESASRQAALVQQHQTGTEQQVDDISSSLKLAVQVLSKEVLFSKLLTHLATITPSNAVLTDLTIDNTQSAVDISALTTDYNAATQLQVNLADPANQLFSKADIGAITCGGTDAHYPCSVTIRALFVSSPHNPFLFVNDGAKP